MDAFEESLAEQSEQGSGMWLDIRAGRFTSSENYRLMGSGKRLMTEAELKARPKSGVGSKAMYCEDITAISTDTETYVREKVAETLTGHSKGQVFAHATAWGDEWEPMAAEYCQEKFGWNLEIVSFVPFGDHAGGSPDRFIIMPDGIKELLEIKCPYNSEKQIGYLELTDQYDVKRELPEYYWQIVFNMFFTATNRGHLCTYDPRMKEDKYKLAHIVIDRKEEDMDLIAKKIEMAVTLKLQMLQRLDKLIKINQS